MTTLHNVLSAYTHSRACAHPTVGDRQPDSLSRSSCLLKALHSSALQRTLRINPRYFRGGMMPGVKHLKDHQKQAPGDKFPEGDDGSVQEELPGQHACSTVQRC